MDDADSRLPDPVEALLARCLADPDTASEEAVARAAAAHPEHAEALRRRYRALEDLGLVAREDSFAVPERLGDFRLLRRLGGGGMGVVYLAEQVSLGRQVALKIVRPESLFFAGARERFVREARVVAGLQHPGIVPIYSVGTEGDVPYFTMERLHGCTLAELLQAVRERRGTRIDGHALHEIVLELAGSDDAERAAEPPPTFSGPAWQVALRLVRQVALALEHAHSRGILHRDVKPSNIMVTPTGRAMLFDFGLARDRSANPLTRTGTELGSLPYMSPEQLADGSRELDERSDVYSLGVTLYELLTLANPFARGGGESTRTAILRGDRVPVRTRNAAVPWDAESVCLVAMDLDRERRYPSAAELALDIENVLAARPIRARRAGLPLRLRRWVQRHTTASVALALGAVLVIGGPLFYAWQQQRAARELQARHQDAVQNLRAAREAADTFFTQVAENVLLNLPNMQPVRTALLERAVEFYEGLVDGGGDDPDLELEAVRARLRLGRVLGELGRFAESEAAFERGLAGLRTAALAAVTDRALYVELIQWVVQHARLLQLDGRAGEAELVLRDTLALVEPLGREHPEDAAVRDALRSVRRRLAATLVHLDRLDEAGAELERAIDLAPPASPVVDLDDESLDFHIRAAETAGLLAARTGRYEDATDPLTRARDFAVELHQREPDDLSRRIMVAESTTKLGRHLFAMGRPDPALPILEQASDLWHDLARGYHAWPTMRIGYAQSRRYLADLLAALGDAKALEHYEEARTALEELLLEQPDSDKGIEALAFVYRRTGVCHALAGRPREAVAQFEAAVGQWQKLLERRQDQAMTRSNLGADLSNLAGTRAGLREFDQAMAAIEQAIDHHEAAVAAAPDNALYRRYLQEARTVRKKLHELLRED